MYFKIDTPILDREREATEAIKSGDYTKAASLYSQIGSLHEQRHEYLKAAKSFRSEETCYKSVQQNCIQAHQLLKAMEASKLAEIAAEKAKKHEPQHPHHSSCHR